MGGLPEQQWHEDHETWSQAEVGRWWTALEKYRITPGKRGIMHTNPAKERLALQ
jgi:hypothetical protein